MVSKVFPWVLCAVLANHKPEERIVETPDFQPVDQKYLGLGLVSEVGAVLWNWILYLVGSDANSRYMVLELNCWTPMWCLKSWQIGLAWGNIHTFSIRSIMSKSCSEAAITKYHRLGGGASGKEPACQCRRHERLGPIPGSGRCPGGGHDNPLQYTYLENPMDRGVWQAIVGSLRVGHDWSNLAHMGGLKPEIYFLTVLETKSARSQRHRVCFWWGLSSWHVFLLCLHMAFA